VRDKLNDNPIAQLALIGLLLVVGVFIFLKPGGGSEESEQAPSGEATATVESSEAGAIASASSGAEVPTSIPAPPRPPGSVTDAYDANKTVVLLVVHDGGIDDAYTAAATAALAAVPSTALFVVPAAKIAHYAALTVGLDVSQVPALVVMRPKRLSHGIPQATVDYGFQTPQSVVQAVIDAGYKGPATTYHPE
jgi:hypothetical protein